MTPTQAIKAIDAAIDASFASHEGTSEERLAHRTKLRALRAEAVAFKDAVRIAKLQKELFRALASLR